MYVAEYVANSDLSSETKPLCRPLRTCIWIFGYPKYVGIFFLAKLLSCLLSTCYSPSLYLCVSGEHGAHV